VLHYCLYNHLLAEGVESKKEYQVVYNVLSLKLKNQFKTFAGALVND